MKRAVHWSDEAAADIEAQIEYIGREDPLAARLVSERIVRTANALGEMATGHFGRVEGTYEKLVRKTPYIVVYSLEKYGGREVVAILRVIHASRGWPDGEWPD